MSVEKKIFWSAANIDTVRTSTTKTHFIENSQVATGMYAAAKTNTTKAHFIKNSQVATGMYPEKNIF